MYQNIILINKYFLYIYTFIELMLIELETTLELDKFDIMFRYCLVFCKKI